MHIMNDCEHCPYAIWDYDDAYGATIRFVDGCKREKQGLECVEEVEEEDG